jgi:transcriptional regulator with XRE-family HTH domain
MNKEGRKKLIAIVKQARGSMSQRGFGILLGVSATAVQSWEKGDSVPDIQNLAQIAAKADYTMEELLNYLGSKPVIKPSEVNQMIKQIRSMPISEVAVIAQVAMDRLIAAAEPPKDEAEAS